MLIDTLNEFSDAQAITGTADSTNIIDLGAEDNQPVGSELYLHVKCVGADFDNLTSLAITLQTAATEALIASAPVALYTKSILLADLTAGSELVRVRVPAGTQRYVQMAYVVTGTDPAAGAIDAFLSPSVDEQGAVTA